MKQLIILLFFILAGFLPVYAASFDIIVVISIDAAHPDIVNKTDMPNLMDIMKNGLVIKNGKSTNPPKTLISHTAMFTGLAPQLSGKTDNSWKKGKPTVDKPTIMDKAKEKGFHTLYIYSKPKLGYLVKSTIDEAHFDPDLPVERSLRQIKNTDKPVFLFLHLSGLDYVGPEHGWLSKEYKEEAYLIDEDLKPLYDYFKTQKSGLIIVTTDHAGHEKIHGSNHPEDAKVFFAISPEKELKNKNEYRVTDLKEILESFF